MGVINYFRGFFGSANLTKEEMFSIALRYSPKTLSKKVINSIDWMSKKSFYFTTKNKEELNEKVLEKLMLKKQIFADKSSETVVGITDFLHRNSGVGGYGESLYKKTNAYKKLEDDLKSVYENYLKDILTNYKYEYFFSSYSNQDSDVSYRALVRTYDLKNGKGNITQLVWNKFDEDTQHYIFSYSEREKDVFYWGQHSEDKGDLFGELGMNKKKDWVFEYMPLNKALVDSSINSDSISE